jgi:hypothetical protein
VQRPCIRLFREGFTFRWARGDEVMTVQRGDYRDGTLAEHVDQVAVPSDGWVDESDVRRRANHWLARQPKTTIVTSARRHS